MGERQCIPDVCRTTRRAGDQDEAIPCESGDARPVLVCFELADRGYGLCMRVNGAARRIGIPGVEADATEVVADEDKARLGLTEFLILGLVVRTEKGNHDRGGTKERVTECRCLDVPCARIDPDAIEVWIVLICYQNGRQ